MSHFTTLQTQMADPRYIRAALADLGYAPPAETAAETAAAAPVRGFAGGRADAEIVVPSRSAGYDIGFRKAGDRYEVVADWWGIRDVTQDEFVRQVTRRYAYHAARAKLEEQGFALVQEEQQADGRLHLVLRRMA